MNRNKDFVNLINCFIHASLKNKGHQIAPSVQQQEWYSIYILRLQNKKVAHTPKGTFSLQYTYVSNGDDQCKETTHRAT